MIKKLETWLFYIFLFSIPISFRYIFHYEPFGFVEWTAKYIYATDILFLTLLGFWVANSKGRAKPFGPVVEGGSKNAERFLRKPTGLVSWVWAKRLSPADYLLLGFLAVSGVSIITALDQSTAIFQWIKLAEGVLLYFYIKQYALKRFDLENGFAAIVCGGAFQGVIATIQFMLQRSIGLKYLGESVLAAGYSGIAAFYADGAKIIRAYGTTPHSNVLAVYLFVALGTFYSIAIYQKRHWIWHVLHAIILWGFLLTFSRVLIGLWFLTFVARTFLIRFYKPFHKEFWENQKIRTRALRIFWTTLGVLAVFAVIYWPYVLNRAEISTSDETVQLRVLYNQESIKSHPALLGHGIGNFVPWLMTQDLHLEHGLYQPVHNIYLLLYSETGIIGAALFVVFVATLLYEFYRRTKFKKLYHFSFMLVVLTILISGLFDHYLLTIQTGRFVLWLALGLMAGAI